MIDTVSTSSITGSSARQLPSAVAAVDAVSAASGVSGGDGGGSSGYTQIRVDNLQNAVILEYRSSRTGEVVWQYPTETQIRAFHHASRLLTQIHAPSSPDDGGHQDAAPVQQQAATVAPLVPPASGDAHTSSGDNSTQSVLI